jgi:glutamate/tyrosine decarboxylase-like PLP-dependent enzyme
MQGSRAGMPMATAWAVMHHLGIDGYRRLVRTTIDTNQKIVEGIKALPELALVGEPEAQIFAFTGRSIDAFALGDALQAHGWFLDRQMPPDSLHGTVSAGNAPVVDDFLTDLRACVAKVAGTRTDDRSTNYATLE